MLTVLIGPDSDVGRAMGGRRYLRPRTLFKRWLDAMPAGTLAAEVVSQLSPPGEPLSTAHAVRMLKLAAEHAVPAVLSNAVRYCAEDGAATADVLDSARTLKSLPELSAAPLLQPNGQGWLKSAAQMLRLGQEIIHAAGYGAADLKSLLAHTEALADRCRMDPVTDMGWKQPVVPEASVIGIAGDPLVELTQRCEAGISRRFPGITGKPAEELRARLEHELRIIDSLGFASYFLTVAEVSRMILDMGVRAAARGSGASSLVNYLIDVSQVNPLQHDLIFERFLSRDRATLPDIDIDVESAERHNVYRKIFERFGSERVTLMSMQNGYRARGAVRDAGLALGMDGGDIDEIAKQLWRFSARNFREALVEKPELKEFAGRVEQRDFTENQQLDLLVDLTERLDRLPRHISMHPCGVILGDATLLDRTPVQPSGLGLPMSQFDKHDMDPMGMLKLDVLGVRMQSAMAFAVREVIRLHPSKAEVVAAGRHPAGPDGTGPDYIAADGRIDLNAVPLDDEPTYELIRSTHTLGCFQIESPGQRELIGKLAPREFNDLIIDISLFRPGPMKSDMVRPFLEHRHGFAPEVYPHPDLKPVLQETHGVTVFHEQILKTFDVMTGCGLARADEFRRALGNEVLESQGGGILPPRSPGPELHARGGGQGLGDPEGLRQLRLLQGPRRRLRRAHLPVGLAQDPPPGSLPGRALGTRPRHVPQAAAGGRSPAAGDPHPAAGHQPQPGRIPGGAGGHRPGPGQARHPAEPERHLRAFRRRAETDRGRPALRLPRGPAGPLPAQQTEHPAPGPAGRLRFAAPLLRRNRQPGRPGPAPAAAAGPAAAQGRRGHRGAAGLAAGRRRAQEPQGRPAGPHAGGEPSGPNWT